MVNFRHHHAATTAVICAVEQAQSIALCLSCAHVEQWNVLQADVLAWQAAHAAQRDVYCYIHQKMPKGVTLPPQVTFVFKHHFSLVGKLIPELQRRLQHKAYDILIDADSNPIVESLIMKSHIKAALRVGRSAACIHDYHIVVQVDEACMPSQYLAQVQKYLLQLANH